MNSTRFSPAKINLNLHILGRRPDGYHELFSLVRFAGFGDQLSFSPGGEADRLEMTGQFAGDIGGENIVLRAARLYHEVVPGLPCGTFCLEKNLPVASGMGGGSANAAAALHLLSAFAPPDPGNALLGRIALQLGADVPVCLGSRTVYMSGIGENIEPAPDFPPCHAVLVNPLVGVSTAAVFEVLQAAPLEKGAVDARAFHAGMSVPDPGSYGSLEAWLLATRNDLEKPAIRTVPEIGTVLESLGQQEGCWLVRMSGSGATCFGLFRTRAQAVQATRILLGNHEDWWIRETVLE